MSTDTGRTRFQDGMRVAREHLEHLQDVLLTGVAGTRESAGLGKVAHGFRVTATSGTTVSVEPGLAFDGQGRPLVLPDGTAVPVTLAAGERAFLVAVHVLRGEGVVDGVPTLLFDDVSVEVRPGPPPYDDDAVPLARIDRISQGIRVAQPGQWFLAPQDHAHSGTFLRAQGRWRYDGDPVAFPPPRFDSGFVALDPGGTVELAHGLGTTEVLAQLVARGSDGTLTTAGLGQAFWFELPDAASIRLVRAHGGAGSLELRATLWPCAGPGGPTRPVADAGEGFSVDPGDSFDLDGRRSRAATGRTIERYEWTELS